MAKKPTNTTDNTTDTNKKTPIAEALTEAGVTPQYENSLLKAYFQTNVALALARKGGGLSKDEVPLTSKMGDCYEEYVEGFGAKFDQAPLNEDGEPIWPSNNKRGLVGGSYDYWQRAADLAMELDNADVQAKFGKATILTIREQDDDNPHYLPGTLDAGDPDLEKLGAFCADRTDWWLRKAYRVLTEVDRVHWKPMHQCARAADVLQALEANVECKDSDVDVNDGSDIDHADTYDIGTMSRAEMRARFGNKTNMELVEFNKWSLLINAAKAWYKVVQLIKAEDLLKERVDQAIQSSKEWVDNQKKLDTKIPGRVRRKAAVMEATKKAS